MADVPLQQPFFSSPTRLNSACQWSAIWGGAFVFAAIWSVFETLGIAIFGSSAGTWRGMGVGMAIWTIILTFIAMYVAGRQTGRMAALTTRNDSLMHGMIMFGLAVVGALLLTVMGSTISTANTHALANLTTEAGAGWAAFLALLLGWIAAMAGASMVVRPAITEVKQTVPLRPAA